VTGAARGIGAATVRALAERGMRVVAVDGCLGDAHGLAGVDYPLATRADLGTLASDSVSIHVADVRDPHAMKRAAQHAVHTFGRLDVGVAAAAVIAGGRPLWETPAAELDTLWQTDVLGVWHTATAVVPHLLGGADPSRCRFVAVASAAASEGLFHLAAYTTVKHAVLGLVRGLAADLTGTGVTAVAVSPDATRTAMLDATVALYGLDSPDPLAANLPGGRPYEPEDVAATVARVCEVGGPDLNGAEVRVGEHPRP